MVKHEKIGILGVPQDLGASRRGVDMGPSSIRIAGLHKKLEMLGYKVIDFGNVSCHDLEESHINISGNSKLRYLDHILETSELMKKALADIIDSNCFPLILGGDHSINIGTMPGLRLLNNGKTGMIWVDAHADFNTPETTTSGNIHGMPLAVNTGRGDKKLTNIGPAPNVMEENTVIIGARDIDRLEADLLKESRLHVFTMSDIDEKGFSKVAKKAIEIATKNVDFLHVSFDIDALDPKEAPGTGTPVQGGLTYREAHLLMEKIHKTNKLSSMEIVEVNPTLDVRNTTALLAVGLISSALGKKIL
jgi:arginase